MSLEHLLQRKNLIRASPLLVLGGTLLVAASFSPRLRLFRDTTSTGEALMAREPAEKDLAPPSLRISNDSRTAGPFHHWIFEPMQFAGDTAPAWCKSPPSSVTFTLSSRHVGTPRMEWDAAKGQLYVQCSMPVTIEKSPRIAPHISAVAWAQGKDGAKERRVELTQQSKWGRGSELGFIFKLGSALRPGDEIKGLALRYQDDDLVMSSRRAGYEKARERVDPVTKQSDPLHVLPPALIGEKLPWELVGKVRGEHTDKPRIVSSSDPLLAGRAVIIDVWATWCGPCMRLKEDLRVLASEYSDSLAVLSINLDETNLTLAEKAIERDHASSPVGVPWIDVSIPTENKDWVNLWGWSLVGEGNSYTIPHVMIITADGKLAVDAHGARAEELREHVKELVAPATK